MSLDVHCKFLGILPTAKGGMLTCTVDHRLIFAAALKASSSIIVAHNHPSGEIRPSRADEELTRRIAEGCKLLDIKVNDHLIITPDSYFSFANQGLL
jgi:DNA repair protein RadC